MKQQGESRWGRNLEGHRLALLPHPSSTEIHAAVGQALEDLQLHVSTEVSRLKELLAPATMPVPRGDEALPDPGTTRAQKARPDVRTSDASSETPSRSLMDTLLLARRSSVNSSFDKGSKEVTRIPTTVTSKASARRAYSSCTSGCSDRLQEELAMEIAQQAKQRNSVGGRRACISRLVRSHKFEAFWIFMVLCNSIIVGVETQYAAFHIGEDMPGPFQKLSYSFALLFLLELILKAAGYGIRELCAGPQRIWALLDTFFVLTSLIEIAAEQLLTGVGGQSVEGSRNLRVVRLIRIIRVVRALRIERLVHMVSSLRTLVFSIGTTLRSLMWAIVLLALMQYMVGVTLTKVVIDYISDHTEACEVCEKLNMYWRSVDVTMFTLFQSICGGLSWDDAMRPLQEVSKEFSWLFAAYIGFTYFAVLNVVTGVFCNSAIESAQHTPEVIGQNLIANRLMYLENLEKLFHSIDEDENAVITFNEFEKVFTSPENRAILAALGIEAMEAWTLFKLIDTDKDGKIQKDEFITGCLQLKGSARNVDLATIHKDLHRLQRKLMRYTNYMEECNKLMKHWFTRRDHREHLRDQFNSSEEV